MMEIYIQREGLQLGPPYSVEEAKSFLADGLLLPDDMAWMEGMADWAPLSNVLPLADRSVDQPIPLTGEVPAVVNAEELASSCFELAIGFQESYTSLLQELQHADIDGQVVDFGQLWIELICLGIFAVEYGLERTLQPGSREAVLNAYHARLKTLQIEGVSNVFELISNRFLIYENAVNSRAINGISWNIGETFAIFCGAELSTRLIVIGSTLFDQIVNYVQQWIGEIGAENIAA
jgi:hypothetical protein